MRLKNRFNTIILDENQILESSSLLVIIKEKKMNKKKLHQVYVSTKDSVRQQLFALVLFVERFHHHELSILQMS